MNNSPAIKVQGLIKYYNDVLAVDHISFEVKTGEIFGFLGPNGAGKTTTIRILTGLSQPSGGTADVLGYDIRTEVVKAKKISGIVPEISNLYDDLTALENLVFAAQLYGVPRKQRRERAEELLKIFSLWQKKDVSFAKLSRGMKRALTIAAALTHKPQLLFLDEPTVGLDVVNARSLRSLVQELHEQGVTVFLTTHYLEEADLLCDRVAFLAHGRIVALDTPEALKSEIRAEPVCQVNFIPVPTSTMELEAQDGVCNVQKYRDGFRVSGASISLLTEAISHFATQSGLEIISFCTVEPTLEDAFVQFTGLNAEVMLAEKGGR